MEGTRVTGGSHLKILRREESLKSRQYRGVCVRVMHERNCLEILRTEMDPGSALDEREVENFPVIHLVLEGSPVFHIGNRAHDLMPGDSIELQEEEPYGVSNPTSSRCSFLSFLFKGAGIQGETRNGRP